MICRNQTGTLHINFWNAPPHRLSIATRRGCVHGFGHDMRLFFQPVSVGRTLPRRRQTVACRLRHIPVLSRNSGIVLVLRAAASHTAAVSRWSPRRPLQQNGGRAGHMCQDSAICGAVAARLTVRRMHERAPGKRAHRMNGSVSQQHCFHKMTPAQKRALFANTARQVGKATRCIQERQVANCAKAGPACGQSIADALAKFAAGELLRAPRRGGENARAATALKTGPRAKMARAPPASKIAWSSLFYGMVEWTSRSPRES
jgi:Catalase-related immune-responsive